MVKILLIVHPNITGLQYYRQLVPHNNLIKNYEGYEVTRAMMVPDDLDKVSDDVLKQHHVISFLRDISFNGNTARFITRCKNLGLLVVLDIDDYWFLGSTHPQYKVYKDFDIPKQKIDALRLVDVVTTTTPWMRSKINEINQNVFILPNSIDPSEPQYEIKEIQNSRLRFGWIGGVFHHADLELIKNNFTLLDKDQTLRDKYQVCLGGYTVPKEKGVPHEYKKIESIMTNDYRMVKFDTRYYEYLNMETNLMEHISFDKPYRRLFGLPVDRYMELYNQIDVSLIPLVDNGFNIMKSQLKIIEAGFMKKAVIVSEIPPYILDCDENNSILVSDNKTGFYTSMKRLINNKEMVSELSLALYDSVKDKYHTTTVNKLRDQIYKHYLFKTY